MDYSFPKDFTTKLNVVIIDDESSARNVLSNLLIKNFQFIEIVTIAVNCQSGIDSIIKYNPELVFLDIEMPDGTGFDVLNKTKFLKFDTILTTAYEQYSNLIHDYSIIDYLLKPIIVSELRSSIQKVFTKRLV
ncbi:MAG: response regulator [Chlorobiota bacterium]|jgi:two-component system LytT family response regulator|nr:response regulator [Chlorobiota bacterium]QQS65921.1 MAG: response regulator [Chlorobiota bacterium]